MTKPSEPKSEEFEFHSGYQTHFDGHVGACNHFEMSACTCNTEEMIAELQKLRRELSEQEAQIESLQIWFPQQARVEIARLRSMVKWQRRRLEKLVVAPILED